MKLNLVLHGTFAYVHFDTYLKIYTPYVWGHSQMAGSRQLPQTLVPGDWKLELSGFGTNPNPKSWPDRKFNAVIDETVAGIQHRDPFDKRYFSMDIPCPKSAEDFYPLAPFEIAENIRIFSGSAAGALNGTLKQFPSAYAFVYEIDKLDSVSLIKEPSTIRMKFPELPASDATPEVANLHIFATLDPVAMGMKGPNDDISHFRRAFAALVDMFVALDLFLEIPQNFRPNPITNYKRPAGLSVEDAELQPLKLSRRIGPPYLGTDLTNCQYSAIHVIAKGP